MSKTYDTAVLRQAAFMVEASGEEVNRSLDQTLRYVRDDVNERLSGAAAQALEETVSDMHGKVTSYIKELAEIGTALRKYAFLLDEADRKASELINQGR